MGSVKDSVVIVTGGAGGIGETISSALANRGAHVVVADIRTDAAESVAARLRAEGLSASAETLDITDPESAAALAESVLHSHGRIDSLVNNAGLDAPHGHPAEIDATHWRHVIDVDLNGAWWCTQAVIPAMVGARTGRIVFISSVAARASGAPISPAYAAAKAGLLGLTVSLATTLERDGILVNAITPGPTGNTGRAFSPEGREAYLAAHPLGFGGPKPIADAVSYLLDDSGDWLSGTVLNVSGGDHRGI
jgi:3-oxoacyl-[acyl-carrier protein] reductase